MPYLTNPPIQSYVRATNQLHGKYVTTILSHYEKIGLPQEGQIQDKDVVFLV